MLDNLKEPESELVNLNVYLFIVLQHTESQLADLRKHLHEYDFRKDDRGIVKESKYTLYKLLFIEGAICGFAGVAMYLMHRGKCQ